MRVRFVVAAFSVAFACPAFGEETYRVDPLHTTTTFSVSHLGLSQQRGSFARTTGLVTLDRAAKKGSIDVLIDAASVTSGSPSREAMLKGEDYFNVAQFPTIAFKANNLKFDGENLVGCEGEPPGRSRCRSRTSNAPSILQPRSRRAGPKSLRASSAPNSA